MPLPSHRRRWRLAFLAFVLATGGALASAPPVDALLASQRVAARLQAATALARDGRDHDARQLVDDALRLADTAAPGDAAWRAAASDAQRAVGAGDSAALDAAARRGADAAHAAMAAQADEDAARQVLVALVRDAVREAGEAVEGGDAEPLTLARALTGRARAVATVLRLPGAAAAGLDALTRALADAPPDAGAVERAADALLASLGAAATQDRTAHYMATIRTDLAAAVRAYRAGDAATAEDRLIDAYLENFEYLEAPLGAVDHELMQGLERALRDDLRTMLHSGASADAFEQATEAVVSDLARAETALR